MHNANTVPYEKMNANFFAQLNKEPFEYSIWSGKAEKKRKKTCLLYTSDAADE